MTKLTTEQEARLNRILTGQEAHRTEFSHKTFDYEHCQWFGANPALLPAELCAALICGYCPRFTQCIKAIRAMRRLHGLRISRRSG